MNTETLGIDDNNGFTELPVGEILRRTRLHYDQSLDDIETHTRIRANLVQALEEGDDEQLPARVYAVGFVRSYAEYLGLDGDHMVHLFKEQSVEKPPEVEKFSASNAQDTSAPPLWLILGSVIVVLVSAGVWNNAQKNDRASVEVVPEVPKEIQDNAFGGSPKAEKTAEAAKLADDTVPLTDETAEAEQVVEAVVPVQKGIILNIRKNSWVEIRDRAGKRLISRVLKAGDQYFVPDRPNLSMSIGNAAGVEIQVDGQTLSPLGKEAEVKRRIPLDGAFLKLQYPTP